MPTHRTNSVFSLLLLSALISGCKAREMGIGFSSTHAKQVDPSWVTAAKSCWPALAHPGYDNEALEANLADPLHPTFALPSVSTPHSVTRKSNRSSAIPSVQRPSPTREASAALRPLY